MKDNENFIDLAFQGGSDGRRDSQSGWQTYIGQYYKNKKIIDIGSGLGNSRPRLSVNDNEVTLQEPAPELQADIKEGLAEIPSDSYEIVTCFDVIEHIPDDNTFLKDLFRVCKNTVFMTTPNFRVFGCKNKYHIREYTPPELVELCEEFSSNLEFLVCNNTTGAGCFKVDRKTFLESNAPALAVFLHK